MTPPPPSWRREALAGARDATPVLLALLPIAMLFGAVARGAGLSFAELMFASASIYAVASQYVMVDLLGQGVPLWSVVLAVFAVNFRHLLYSAAIGRHLQQFSTAQKVLAFFLLVDPQYAASEARAQGLGLRPSYYFAYAAMVYGPWLSANAVGASFGSLIAQPEALALDFILPLYFAGLVAGFHRRPQFALVLGCSVTAAGATYLALGSPSHITVGALCGIAAAALTAREPAADDT